MLRRIAIFAVILGALALAAADANPGGTGHTQPHELDDYTFEDWIAEYKRPEATSAPYLTSGEFSKRKAVFEANLAAIKQHNANPNRSWTMNINQFGDLTREEFVARYTGYSQDLARELRRDNNLALGAAPHPSRLTAGNSSDGAPFPTSIDWREKGVVTPVKTQGRCGSCWAFAAIAAFESHAAIATGQLVELSPQQLTSCVANPRRCGGAGGCYGATCQLGFEYWKKVGVTTNKLYPYTSGSSGRSGSCRFNAKKMPPVFRSTGYAQLPTNDAAAHVAALQKGPLGVSVASDKMMFYSSGVFDTCGDTTVNHLVVMDGYGEDAQGRKYWLVRNSWGPTWGEQGYIRVARFDTEQCGIDRNPQAGSGCAGGPSQLTVCGCLGILSDSSYPTGITLA